jgi:hypothetical protein
MNEDYYDEPEQSDEEITGMKMEEVKARLRKMKGVEVVEV